MKARGRGGARARGRGGARGRGRGLGAGAEQRGVHGGVLAARGSAAKGSNCNVGKSNTGVFVAIGASALLDWQQKVSMIEIYKKIKE